MVKIKSRYRFLYRRSSPAGDWYYWENVRPTDSRTETLMCRVEWFWGTK